MSLLTLCPGRDGIPARQNGSAPGLVSGLVHEIDRAALDELYLIQPLKLVCWGKRVEAEHADYGLHIQPHRAAHAAIPPLARAALEGLDGLPVLRQHLEQIRLGCRCLGFFCQLPFQRDPQRRQVFLDQAGLAVAGIRPVTAGLDQIRGRFFFATLS
ncbi:hypothetical protein M8006_17425 [Halomonas sp. ATCHA]|uniref:Uncharacterized protein n=1 Tax=Halomonas llamarensis TaxID=2945104 RepID=A0ABT0SV72_9GAMM|nr:hypothetical protein [Halomonas llamarensis]MCL7931735.1 hypothetical protein [Halomonas llamarensis]